MDHLEARRLTYALIARLKERRLALGLSKRKTAALAGLDPKALTFLERGDRIPSVATLMRLAHALEVKLSAEFLRLENPET